jgi:hypothetical protein
MHCDILRAQTSLLPDMDPIKTLSKPSNFIHYMYRVNWDDLKLSFCHHVGWTSGFWLKSWVGAELNFQRTVAPKPA